MKQASILIVDDEIHTREALTRYLRGRFEVSCAEDGAAAIALLKSRDFDLVLTDLRMPGADGMSVLEAALSKASPPVCVVFSAYGTIESAVAAVKAGAFDFVPKPVKLDRLDRVIDKALARRAAEAPPEVPERSLTSSGAPVVGVSPAMREIAELVRDAAPSRINILICGESGTGKEVIARAIHDASGRKGLFVPVHCAALAANLLESELFGHEKGAFTGAVEMRRGRFELADGGTLFLDEIGEIELSVQVKLLRVLETRTIERVGGHEPIACDARLVAATHRDLGEMVKAGTFREDLYYRLGGIQLTMPPLRERKEDIPALVERFMAQASEENNRQVGAIAPEALAALVNYPWPGNIRELRHCIERMVVLSRGHRLEIGDVPDKILHGESAVPAIRPVYPVVATPAAPTLEARERELIMDALKRCAGNRTLAAKELGISRRTLHRRLKEYEMETNPGKEV